MGLDDDDEEEEEEPSSASFVTPAMLPMLASLGSKPALKARTSISVPHSNAHTCGGGGGDSDSDNGVCSGGSDGGCCPSGDDDNDDNSVGDTSAVDVSNTSTPALP